MTPVHWQMADTTTTAQDGIAITTLANPDLKWEKTTTYNVGLDFGFLNNRINGAVDYYYRKTTDLLNSVFVSAGTNFKTRYCPTSVH